MGRRIFDNLKKATRYIFALHVPIAGMSFFPVLLNWPLALLPMHVVFLELVTDPACSIAFEAEPEESDVMNRPPRNRAETLLTRGGALLSLLEGGSILAVALTVYALSLRAGYGGPYSRALAFTALIVANVALMLSSRSSTGTLLQIARTPNPSLRWIILLTIVSLSSVLFVPFLREVFQFAPVPLSRLALAVLAGAASLAWLELWKIFRRVKT
jgi:Ca2+-transporting ATPase